MSFAPIEWRDNWLHNSARPLWHHLSGPTIPQTVRLFDLLYFPAAIWKFDSIGGKQPVDPILFEQPPQYLPITIRLHLFCFGSNLHYQRVTLSDGSSLVLRFTGHKLGRLIITCSSPLNQHLTIHWSAKNWESECVVSSIHSRGRNS